MSFRPKSWANWHAHLEGDQARSAHEFDLYSDSVIHARRTADLDELEILDTYPRLDATSATALMRSARLYQEALWLSEREAWLTWLLLVSAVETAANEHKYAPEPTPPDILRELDPTLAGRSFSGGKASSCRQRLPN